MGKTWKNGGTGKGSALRRDHNQEAINETLDRIETKGEFKQRCSTCLHFKGVNMFSHAICKKGVKKQVVGEDCKSWER